MGDASTAAVLGAINGTGVPLIGAASGELGVRRPFQKQAVFVRPSFLDEVMALVRYLQALGLASIAAVCPVAPHGVV